MGRVLIVDDAEDSIILLKSYLAEGNHEILTANDAFSAIDILDKHRVDLALVDIEMPHMNGFDLVLRLRNTRRHKLLPIYFVTGRNSMKDIEKASRYDISGYIVKPVDRNLFQEKINTFLKHNQSVKSLSYDVEKESKENLATLRIEQQAKILKITELGVTIESSKDFEPELELDLSSMFFHKMDVGSVSLKLMSQKHDGIKKVYIGSFMYHQVSQESMQKILSWLQLQSR